MEEYPAVVRRWKDVISGDKVLIGEPAEMLTVTKIIVKPHVLGMGRRYIDVEPPNTPGGVRSYLRFDDDYATVLMKEGK